jgi:DnaK suppressor protein
MSPDRARSLLDAERRRTAGRLSRLREDHLDFVDASRDSNADDEHDPEGATIAFERSQVEALARQAKQHLAEVAAAEERLAAGTYGACATCGSSIPDDRLEARPTAVTCVTCPEPHTTP